jgi:hypothetical protein
LAKVPSHPLINGSGLQDRSPVGLTLRLPVAQPGGRPELARDITPDHIQTLRRVDGLAPQQQRPGPRPQDGSLIV